MFPAILPEVIRQLQPRAFMIENVRGLTRAAFTNYFLISSFDWPTLISHLVRVNLGQITMGASRLNTLQRTPICNTKWLLS